jgi:hypothetical protein
MKRSAWVITAGVVVVVLLALGSALGWFSAVEAPGPAASAPEAGGTPQQQ